MSDKNCLEETQHDLLLVITTAITILFSTGLAEETGGIDDDVIIP